MLLRDLTRALLRRWYLLLLGVALAGVAAFYVWDTVGPRYNSVGSTVLIPPKSSIEGIAPHGRDGNPLLYLGELGQARDVLISALSSDAVQEDFTERFPGSSYSVGVDPLSNGPIIVLSVNSASAAEALEGVRFLSAEVDDRFSAVQRSLSVEADDEIRTMVLTEPSAPVADNKSQVRLALVVAGGVLLICIFLVALVDGLAAAYRRRRALGTHVASPAGDDPAGDARAAASAGDASEVEPAPVDPDGAHPATAQPEQEQARPAPDAAQPRPAPTRRRRRASRKVVAPHSAPDSVEAHGPADDASDAGRTAEAEPTLPVEGSTLFVSQNS
nr:hypothetical protein [Propionicimonas sp.]